MSENESYQQITVGVPSPRVPEFYEMFGRWLAGTGQGGMDSAVPDPSLVPFAEASPDAVGEWWKLLTKSARRVLVLLAEDPGSQLSGSEIAEACGIENGASGVAGTLSWPGKYAYNRFGLDFPLSWDRENQKYSMDPDVAALIEQARRTVGDA